MDYWGGGGAKCMLPPLSNYWGGAWPPCSYAYGMVTAKITKKSVDMSVEVSLSLTTFFSGIFSDIRDCSNVGTQAPRL